MSTTRVTLTLDRRVLEETRSLGEANISQLVNSLLRSRLDVLRRQRLREELRQGYVAEGETDLEVTREFRHVDTEAEAREEV